MTERNDAGGNFTRQWDVENRLVSVTEGSNVTTFVCDTAGNRVKTVRPDGTIIYYPFSVSNYGRNAPVVYDIPPNYEWKTAVTSQI